METGITIGNSTFEKTKSDLNYSPSLEQSRLEFNLEHVSIHLEMSGNVNAVRNKHIVAFENFLAIEPDRCEGIKAIESEYRGRTLL